MRTSINLFILAVLFVSTFSVYAKNIKGCFEASQSCEAYQSFRKKTNPGGVRLEEGKQYTIFEKSKKMSAYRIQVDGIKNSARWVKSSCGELLKSCSKGSQKLLTGATNKLGQYLLALSWQPGFCETHSGKKECRSQTSNRYDAKHWSLHGLWPQPRANTYCGVSEIDKGIDRNKRWHLLEPVKLSLNTATELAFVMPGMASNLHRHEWIKHGTCYGADAESYYADSINLTKQINQSAVGRLFSNSLGRRVSLKEIRRRFDESFGKGAGTKVNLRCDRKGRIGELWINLTGKISPETPLSTLLANAIDAESSCQVGVVDRANR